MILFKNLRECRGNFIRSNEVREGMGVMITKRWVEDYYTELGVFLFTSSK